MSSRRHFVFGLAAGAALLTCAEASTYGRVMKAGRPKLIKGTPNKVDFGHGLVVPMNHDAFETLWEGDDRWIAYGHGFGSTEAKAMGQAEEAAIGTMKLFLLTLAFAPERLERFETCGWRLKSGKLTDLVHGDVSLPGRPVLPTVDHVNAYDTANSGSSSNESPEDTSSHATTGWVVWKSDITLDQIRKMAALVNAG